MAALTASRLTKTGHLGATKAYLAADSLTFYDGGMVMLDSAGLLRPAVAAAGNLGGVGVCTLTPAGGFADGSKASGTGGDVWIPVQEGVFLFVGVGLVQADVGTTGFASDDQTFSGTQGANEPSMGTIIEFISATSAYIYITFLK